MAMVLHLVLLINLTGLVLLLPRALTGTPGYDKAGDYTNIVITVTDGTLSASLSSFNITVNNTNRAPTISGAFFYIC